MTRGYDDTLAVRGSRLPMMARGSTSRDAERVVVPASNQSGGSTGPMLWRSTGTRTNRRGSGREAAVRAGRAPEHRLSGMADPSRDDVAHLASLARIDLSDAELDTMVGELDVILSSVAQVQQAPVDGVEPMSHPMPIVNVTRPD